MTMPLTHDQQVLARVQARMIRAVERTLRQIYLAQSAQRSLAWGSGMTAAIEIVQRMAASLESAAPPDYTPDQAENMEWQKIVGLVMEKLQQTHVVLELDWMATFADLPEASQKVILAHQKLDGLHILLLPAAQAQAYADLSDQVQV